MGYLYEHDASAPLAPSPAEAARAARAISLRARGAILCARDPSRGFTDRDLDTAEWFMAFLAAPGRVPFPGCARCERVASITPEPGQVISCGEHSFVRRGEERPGDLQP